MRLAFPCLAALCTISFGLFGQTPADFSGTWSLNQSASDIRDLSSPPARMLNVEQTASALTVHASMEPGVPSTSLVCPFGGTSKKSQIGDATWNVASKWEGSALLLNIIVSGSTNYSIFERWSRSRDGNRITITRTVNRPSGETESTFVYVNPLAPGTPAREVSTKIIEPVRPPEPIRRAGTERVPEPPSEYTITSGTRILMRLTSPVDTKHSVVGDRVYLETAVPVFLNSRLIIPAGTYVTGSVTETQRAGRIKGKSALNLRFESLTLPNGVSRDFRARPGSTDSQGNLDRAEGRIKGEGKSGGAGTVARTTAAGAGVGGIIGAATGHAASGLGIGAAAGAAAGLAGVFGSRGSDVILRQGTTIEMVLDRDLVFKPEDLRQ